MKVIVTIYEKKIYGWKNCYACKKRQRSRKSQNYGWCKNCVKGLPPRTMNRFYKITDLTICVNETIKTMPSNLWRDLSRCGWSSTDLAIGANGGYCIYRFANKAGVERAVAILQGGLFTEVNAEQWETIACIE